MAGEESDPATDGGNESGDGETESEDRNLTTAVASFLAEFDTVCEEYDRGYVDADAALERVRRAATDLETVLDEADR